MEKVDEGSGTELVGGENDREEVEVRCYGE